MLAAGLLGVAHVASPVRTAAANPNIPFQDTDGDLLPDSLEWVLMTQPTSPDSDRDGVDDFLEAVQHVPPRSPGKRRKPLDQEMRVVASVARTPDGARHLIVNLLFRIVGGLDQVKSLGTFVHLNGVRFPLGRLLGDGLVHMAMRSDPKRGTYLLMSSRIATNGEIDLLLPCTIGATGVIGNRRVMSGTYLLDVDGAVSAMVPLDDRDFVFQPLAIEQGPKENPFWKGSHACVLQLDVLGSSAGSHVCEVLDAACEGAPTLRCAPSCPKMSGKVVVVPYGLGLLRGG